MAAGGQNQHNRGLAQYEVSEEASGDGRGFQSLQALLDAIQTISGRPHSSPGRHFHHRPCSLTRHLARCLCCAPLTCRLLSRALETSRRCPASPRCDSGSSSPAITLPLLVTRFAAAAGHRSPRRVHGGSTGHVHVSPLPGRVRGPLVTSSPLVPASLTHTHPAAGHRARSEGARRHLPATRSRCASRTSYGATRRRALPATGTRSTTPTGATTHWAA